MVYGDKEVLLNMSSVIDIKENKYLLILVYNPNHYGSIRFEFEGLSYEEILPNKEYYILYVKAEFLQFSAYTVISVVPVVPYITKPLLKRFVCPVYAEAKYVQGKIGVSRKLYPRKPLQTIFPACSHERGKTLGRIVVCKAYKGEMPFLSGFCDRFHAQSPVRIVAVDMHIDQYHLFAAGLLFVRCFRG